MNSKNEFPKWSVNPHEFKTSFQNLLTFDLQFVINFPMLFVYGLKHHKRNDATLLKGFGRCFDLSQ